MEEALAIAESNAFSLRTAASALERARQRVIESQGALGPRVSASAAYSRFEPTQGGFSGSLGGPGSTQINIPGINDSKTAGINLTLPIDISGTTHKNITAQRYFFRAQQEAYNAARNDLRLNVRQAYFQVLEADAQVGVAREALTNAQAQLTNAQQQLAAGVIARVDVLTFETQVSQAQADLIAAQNSLGIAKNNFNNVLGRPIETPFQLAPVTDLPSVTADTTTLVAQAAAERPELREQRDTIEALRNVRLATEAGMDPSLALTASHNRVFDNNFNSTYQTIGTLSLAVPIFDSGVTRARVREARQDEAQAQIGLEQQTLGISLEVRQALTNLVNARARLDVAQRQVEQARERYRLAVVRYQAGEGIQLEISDAQANLTRAETGLVNARYDYLRAYAALQRALGIDTVGAPTSTGTPGPTR
jgi:outer membrane protein